MKEVTQKPLLYTCYFNISFLSKYTYIIIFILETIFPQLILSVKTILKKSSNHFVCIFFYCTNISCLTTGYVCNRTSVDARGCCHVKRGSRLTSKHRCDTCSKNACCVVYEYCVACCLKPDKVGSSRSLPFLKDYLCIIYFNLSKKFYLFHT